MGIENGSVKYKGSTDNGITSLDYDGPWDRSIVVNTYNVKCPQDNFKKQSFLQYSYSTYRTTNDDNTKSDSSTTSTSSDTSSTSSSSNSGSSSSSGTSSSSGSSSNSSSDSSSTGSTSTGSGSSSTSTGTGGSTTAGAKTGGSSTTANKGAEDGKAQGTPGGGGDRDHGSDDQKITIQKVENTKQAIEKLDGILNMDKEDLRRQIRLVSDSSTLVSKLSVQMSPVVTSDLSPDFQLKFLDSLDMHLIGSIGEMNKLVAEAKEKVKQRMMVKKKLIKKKLKLLRFVPYEEKYKIDLDLVYTVKTFKNAVEGPANWAFTKQNLKGHVNAIGQTSNVRIVGGHDTPDATHLILNYKRYYDGKLILKNKRNNNGLFK